MVLSLKVLNEDATLNNFRDIGNATMVKGSAAVLIFQLIQPDGLRYVPEAGATVSMDFKNSDNTTLTKSASFPFADDRSIIQIDLLTSDTDLLVSQNLVATVTEGPDVTYALKKLGLQIISLTMGV